MSEQEMDVREPDAFEQALAKVLRRVDAPEGFAERVMGRVSSKPGDSAYPTHDDETVMHGAPGDRTSHVSEARPFGYAQGRLRAPGQTSPRVLVMRKPQAWIGGAIAAVLVMGAFGAEQVHVRRARERAATQQFEAATRITDQALRQTREQLALAGVSLE